MGQGFTLINYTKRERVSPHDLGLGYKLGEFGLFRGEDFEGSLIQYARELTAEGGRWEGDTIYYVGDYGDVLDAEGYYTSSLIEFDGVDGSEFTSIPQKTVREWVQSKALDARDLENRINFWTTMDKVDAYLDEMEKNAPSDSGSVR